MKIRHIEIENFRRFREPVIVSEIGDGLTVLAGDNEAGKSTLLRALQAALFDRHNIGKSVARTFLPFQSEVQPLVTLEFECGGVSYRLRKGFYQKPFAELKQTSGTALYKDAEAEEKLQELLRFEGSARGLSGVAEHGILGLLWLEQGASSKRWQAALADKDGPAGHSLHAALEGELGAVLGGPYGQQILLRIAERYGEFFGKNGRPRGAYAQAQTQIQELQDRLDEVQRELGRSQTASDELTGAKQRLAGFDREGRLSRAQLALRQAAEADQRIKSLQSALREAEEKKKTADVQRQLSAQNHTQRDNALTAIESERRRLAEKQATLEQHQASVHERELAKTSAEGQLATVQAEVQHLTVELQRHERSLDRRRCQREAASYRQRLQQARDIEVQGRRLAEQERSLVVNDAVLKQLRQLREDLRAAEGRLDAVATRVDVALKAGLELRQDGQAVDRSQPLFLTQKTELSLWQGEARLGALTIHPGAEDLTLRQERVEQLRSALHDKLQAAGVADIDAAEAQAKTRNELSQQVQQLREKFKESAPRGIEPLLIELQRIEAQLAQLSADEPTAEDERAEGADGEAEAAEQQLAERCAELRRQLQQVQSDLKQAQTRVTVAQQSCQEQTQLQARLQGELQSGSEALQAKEAALVEARHRVADADLQRALSEAQAHFDVAESLVLAAQRELAAAQPQQVTAELLARQREVETLKAEVDQLTQQVARLEGELGGLGQQDFGEREEALQLQLQRAQTLLEQQTQQAEALRLLQEVLQDAERRARADFMLPVERRVEPYLRQLLPDSRLQFAPGDYALSELQRGGVSEPFDALSIGTREQLAVISRLAFADLLHQQGQPTCLLFDDVLVFSDDRRFQIMLTALREAAKSQQILILTCRGRDYENRALTVRQFPDSQVRRAV